MSMFTEIQKEFALLKTTKNPLSDCAHKMNFKMVQTVDEDENFRAEYVEGGDKYIISIKSFEHCKTFELRPDTVHNYLYHYREEKLIEEAEYMYVEEMN